MTFEGDDYLVSSVQVRPKHGTEPYLKIPNESSLSNIFYQRGHADGPQLTEISEKALMETSIFGEGGGD